MKRLLATFTITMLGATPSGCNNSAEPEPTGPDLDEPTDTAARRDVIQDVYHQIAMFSTGTDSPLRFELGDFETGSVDEIRTTPLSEIATVGERHINVHRRTFQSAGLPNAAVYEARWASGPRWRDGFEAQIADMNLGEFLDAQGANSQAPGIYVGYRVTVFLDGQTLSYAGLWIQIEAGDDLRDLYTVDHVLGTELVSNAVRDRAARRQSMFQVYETVDAERAAELAAATLYRHAPCPDPLVGAANAGSERSEVGHAFFGQWNDGHHWFEWSLQGTCTYADIGWGCSASCTGTSSSSSGETTADDIPPFCHYTNDSAAYGSGTADPNSSVTCSGAAMAVVKRCICGLGCSVQVRIVPMGLGVVIEADSGYDTFGPKNDSITCSGIPHS